VNQPQQTSRDSRPSIFLAKLGTQPELAGLVPRLAELLPETRLLGIGVKGVDDSPHLKIVAHERQVVLGAFDPWWSDQLFVDPDLYVKIQPRESQLLRMVERVARHDVFQVDTPSFPTEPFSDSFDGRSQLLLRQIAYWDWVIRTENVSAVVSQNLPHNFWDAVLHAVAEAREIPYLYFHEVRPFLSSLYVYERLEEMGNLDKCSELIRAAATRYSMMPDWVGRKEFMRQQVKESSALLHRAAGRRQTFSLARRVRLLITPPRYIAFKLRRAARRRLQDARSRRREDRVVQSSSVPARYFLLELQIQGNATNLVKGFMYGETREMVAHVAHSLPEDCVLLVRESSRQGSRKQPRREAFWRQLSALPKVQVIVDELNSRELLQKSLGLIELGYSSLALEAINLDVPVVVLGLTHLHGAPNSFVVTQSSSLPDVLRTVRDKSLNDVRSPETAQIALEKWADTSRAATIQGSLTSTPKNLDKDPEYCERIVNNVAQLVATWYRSRVG